MKFPACDLGANPQHCLGGRGGRGSRSPGPRRRTVMLRHARILHLGRKVLRMVLRKAQGQPHLAPCTLRNVQASGCGDLKWEAQCCVRCHVAAVAAVACGRGSLCGPAATTVRTLSTAQRASQLPSCTHHMTLHHHLACAARAQKHDEQCRFCSPESWVSHQCQLTQWCAQFTTCGLGWEGACRV